MNTKRHQGVLRGTEGLLRGKKRYQMNQKVPKGTKSYQEVPRETERYRGLPRGNKR